MWCVVNGSGENGSSFAAEAGLHAGAAVELSLLEGRLVVQPSTPPPLTLDQLLRMSSGLDWIEAYVAGVPSDVNEMLFFSGKGDVAGANADAARQFRRGDGSGWPYLRPGRLRYRL